MTEWSRLVEYCCKVCREKCINDHRDSCSKHRECRDCHHLPDLDVSTDATPLEDNGPAGHKAAGSLDFPEGSRTEPDGSRPRQKGPKGPQRPAVLWEDRIDD